MAMPAPVNVNPYPRRLLAAVAGYSAVALLELSTNPKGHEASLFIFAIALPTATALFLADISQEIMRGFEVEETDRLKVIKLAQLLPIAGTLALLLESAPWAALGFGITIVYWAYWIAKRSAKIRRPAA